MAREDLIRLFCSTYEYNNIRTSLQYINNNICTVKKRIFYIIDIIIMIIIIISNNYELYGANGVRE